MCGSRQEVLDSKRKVMPTNWSLGDVCAQCECSDIGRVERAPSQGKAFFFRKRNALLRGQLRCVIVVMPVAGKCSNRRQLRTGTTNGTAHFSATVERQ